VRIVWFDRNCTLTWAIRDRVCMPDPDGLTLSPFRSDHIGFDMKARPKLRNITRAGNHVVVVLPCIGCNSPFACAHKRDAQRTINVHWGMFTTHNEGCPFPSEHYIKQPPNPTGLANLEGGVTSRSNLMLTPACSSRVAGRIAPRSDHSNCAYSR
jgi:hypothetical protein